MQSRQSSGRNPVRVQVRPKCETIEEAMRNSDPLRLYPLFRLFLACRRKRRHQESYRKEEIWTLLWELRAVEEQQLKAPAVKLDQVLPGQDELAPSEDLDLQLESALIQAAKQKADRESCFLARRLQWVAPKARSLPEHSSVGSWPSVVTRTPQQSLEVVKVCLVLAF